MDILPIVLGVVGGILGVGILLLILWKILTSRYDEIEYARFKEEINNPKWGQVLFCLLLTVWPAPHLPVHLCWLFMNKVWNYLQLKTNICKLRPCLLPIDGIMYLQCRVLFIAQKTITITSKNRTTGTSCLPSIRCKMDTLMIFYTRFIVFCIAFMLFNIFHCRRGIQFLETLQQFSTIQILKEVNLWRTNSRELKEDLSSFIILMLSCSWRYRNSNIRVLTENEIWLQSNNRESQYKMNIRSVQSSPYVIRPSELTSSTDQAERRMKWTSSCIIRLFL